MKRILEILSVAVTVILLFSVSANGKMIIDPSVIRSCSSKGKKIALTFDDGPHPRYTPEILDILSDYNIKATFFVIGENVQLYPELIKDELSRGHIIGNHTLSHTSLLQADNKELSYEIGSLDKILREKFGCETTLIRPPGGQFSENLCSFAAENGKSIILWSVDTRDWAHTPVDAIKKNVLENTSDGAIILFHDFVGGAASPTPEALRNVIPALLSEGYEFVTVTELIGKQEQ